MFDYRKIEQQVKDYAGEFVEDFDLEGIMDELRDMDVESIDDVDPDEFNEILERHAVSE